ncbi:MAG: hypothetical protein K0S39_4026 [Paenibacillus sp.]|jgi:hypothetical protein|nr:hypothetical protein [Paenibacillus sp.]
MNSEKDTQKNEIHKTAMELAAEVDAPADVEKGINEAMKDAEDNR